jgi:hypothetical protein
VSGGYEYVPTDPIERLIFLLDRLSARVSELERPTGTQTAEAVQTLTDLVEGILEQDEVNVSGNVTAGGMGTFTGGLNSVDVYSRLVTGSGSFRATSTNILGQMGQTVSSRRYKQDIETADVSREQLRALRVVFFRYLAHVPFDQDQQPLMLGLIAEEVHDLGLHWLVVYDDEGRPEALVDFALPFIGLLLAQYNAADIDSLRQRMDAAGI